MVDVIRPPTSTTPMDWRSSAPSPMPMAIGSMPKMVESVVISIGRRRSEQASSVALRISSPFSRCWLA